MKRFARIGIMIDTIEVGDNPWILRIPWFLHLWCREGQPLIGTVENNLLLFVCEVFVEDFCWDFVVFAGSLQHKIIV